MFRKKYKMENKIVLVLLFLVSGFTFSQTTVTLQDQCNCEVLSGTAVNAPGLTAPAGADTGDIYVNTNTGTIYFWDGSSWELTSSDNQQLQNFTFNPSTNQLSLAIEGGNTVSVDLSALDGINTDDQQLSLSGNTLTLEDGGTVNLSGYLDNTDDQTITGLSLDASNILSITLENGNTRILDLSALLGTDDQNLSTDGTAGNISIEDGNSIALNVNDADADPANEYNTGISFDGTNLTVADAGGNQSVDISGVSTDDQDISGSGLSGTDLTIGIENGSAQVVDLSSLVGTDDQDLTGATLNPGNILQIDIENGASTTVDLSALDNSGSDDQNISGSGLSGTDLTIGIENGASEVVDLSALQGTDDQNLSTDGSAGNISIEDGNSIALNVNDADADPANEFNSGISFDGTNLTVTTCVPEHRSSTSETTTTASAAFRKL
jgi:hypothetical protein